MLYFYQFFERHKQYKRKCLIFFEVYYIISTVANIVSRCDGMADVTDSKSVGGDTVRVQVPPPAPKKHDGFDTKPSCFFYIG